MASNELRGHKGDFIATIARQDPKDLKLRAVLSKYLEYTLGWFSIIFEALFLLTQQSTQQSTHSFDSIDNRLAFSLAWLRCKCLVIFKTAL